MAGLHLNIFYSLLNQSYLLSYAFILIKFDDEPFRKIELEFLVKQKAEIQKYTRSVAK